MCLEAIKRERRQNRGINSALHTQENESINSTKLSRGSAACKAFYSVVCEKN